MHKHIDRLRYTTSVLLLLAILPSGVWASSSHRATGNPLKWKLAWAWSLAGRSDQEIVSAAKSLGFNIIVSGSPRMIEECHKQGMKAAGLVVFGGAPESAVQKISPAEEEIVRQEKTSQPALYQYGGEPIIPGEVMIEDGLWCYDRPETLDYGKREIDRVISAGYDLIAFDYIGYRNYHACFCPASSARHAAYLKAHPEMGRDGAIDAYSREALVSFYNALVSYAKSRKPGIETTAHLYPYFRPDPLYGNETTLDYCGQTVTWFFQPHWSLEKVKRYTRKVVCEAGRFRPASKGAPFVAIYTLHPYEKHRKSAERVRRELRIIKDSGATAIQFAELGNILNDPGIARVVREELTDSAVQHHRQDN